jgi:hypothetical protein
LPSDLVIAKDGVDPYRRSDRPVSRKAFTFLVSIEFTSSPVPQLGGTSSATKHETFSQHGSDRGVLVQGTSFDLLQKPLV